MKIYLAAPYSARDHIRDLRDSISLLNIKVTSGWLNGGSEINETTIGASWASSDERVKKGTSGDFADIDAADGVLMFTGNFIRKVWPSINEDTLHTGGRHVEVGYALAHKKPVVILGEFENVFQRGMCTQAGSVSAALRSMQFLLAKEGESTEPQEATCPTQGCSGDGRYAAPGRGHATHCRYPMPWIPTEQEQP